MYESRFTPDTRLTLYPLVTRREGESFIIGRVETGTFVSVPEVGVRIVEALRQGESLAQAGARLAAEGLATPDLPAFAADLLDLGFLRAVNGDPLPRPERFPTPLPWLSPRLVRWVFSWPSALAFASLLAAAAVSALRLPGILPTPVDFFWSPLLSMVVAVNLVFWISHRALHEIAHVAAARSLGIPFQLRPGRRHRSLILRADVSGAWALPRSLRLRVYGAGLLWDTSVVSTLILLLAYAPLTTTLHALLSSWLLIALLALLGEFRFSARTDVSQICLDLLPIHDPFAAIRRRLRARAPRGAAAIYRLALTTLTGLVIGGILLLVLPVLAGLVSRAADHVISGIQSADPSQILDGVFPLITTAAVIALGLDSVLQRRLTTLTSPSAQVRRRFLVSRTPPEPSAALDPAVSAPRTRS